MYNIHKIACCFGNSHNEDGFHPSVELEPENEQKAPSSGKVNELHPIQWMRTVPKYPDRPHVDI